MRASSLLLAVCLGIGLSADPSAALGRTGTHSTVIPEWNSSAKCQISYYNTCTGWIWAWGNVRREDNVGVAFEACCSGATLEESRIFMLQGSPPGYGFTGTIEIRTSPPDSCGVIDGTLLASQSWLPVAGDNVFSWGVPVPECFAIVARAGRWFYPWSNPAEFASDHPAPGPTGVDCYPHDGESRTFHLFAHSDEDPWVPLDWNPQSSLCEIHGWDCYVEFAFDAGVSCAVHTESKSWGGVKALYR